MNKISKDIVKNAILTIKEEKKNIEKIKKEIEKYGLLTTENKKGMRNINKLHDIRFKNSIIKLKNNLAFIKEFKNYNMFVPLFDNIEPPINRGKNKKIKIQKDIERKEYKGFDNTSFLLLPFKKDIREKIKKEIKSKIVELKEKLEELSVLVYEQLNPQNEEHKEKLDKIEKEGIQPLTELGKLWDFLITTTPNKKDLVNYIDILLNFSLEEILSNKKEIEKFSDKTFSQKIENFKKHKNIYTLQPLRTSLLLFNQYISQLEREIIINKYYKKENFNKEYKEFLKELEQIKNIFNLKIELTEAQKILTFSYIKDITDHIKNSKKLQPITILNTSEVGTGKTFTLPFVAYTIAIKYLEKYSKKAIFLLITEANLLIETKQKIVEEVGLDEENIKIIENNNIEKMELNPWDIYLISKNRFQMLNNDSIRNLSRKIRKQNLLINLILDEASYLKNHSSKTSKIYQRFKSNLIKEKILGFEMLMTATPISNDTKDIIYFVNPHKKIIQKLQKEVHKDTTKLQGFSKSYKRLFEEKLTFKEVLKLAAFGYDKSIKIDKNTHIETKAAVLLSAYHRKHFNLQKYIDKLNENQKNKDTENTNTKNIIDEISIIQKETGIIGQKVNEKNFRKGKKDKNISIKLIDCLSELSDIKGIDRILNSKDINNSVLTNSIVLETNFIETSIFNEMIKNARIISNFQRFRDLINLLNQFNVENKRIKKEKFLIRHYLISQILNDSEMIKTINITTKEKSLNNAKINKIIVNKIEYLSALRKVLETEKNKENLLKKFIIEINPIGYFRLKDIEQEIKQTSLNVRKKELENIRLKLKNEITQEILSILDIERKNLKSAFIDQIKKDIKIIENTQDNRIEFNPVSLSSYKNFLMEIEEDLKIEPKLESIINNPQLYNDIFQEKTNLLNIYSAIFQASESLNMPIISKHLKRATRTIKQLIEKYIQITNFDFEKFIDFISKNASTTLNTMKKVKNFCSLNNTPILITTNYKDSVELLKDNNNLKITGELSQKKKKEIIDEANKLENNKSIITTAQAILKGISFYYIPYGILTETPKNAEFRTQISGRLRNLFPHHIKEIEKASEKIKNKEKCLTILKRNQKYFDIISSEIMLSFPNIQQEKNILVESIKYISQHKDITEIQIKETLSKEDSKYGHIFNKEIIEEYSEKIKKEKLKDFLKHIENKQNQEMTTEELINIISKYLDEIAERNLKKTTIYKLLT